MEVNTLLDIDILQTGSQVVHDLEVEHAHECKNACVRLHEHDILDFVACEMHHNMDHKAECHDQGADSSATAGPAQFKGRQKADGEHDSRVPTGREQSSFVTVLSSEPGSFIMVLSSEPGSFITVLSSKPGSFVMVLSSEPGSTGLSSKPSCKLSSTGLISELSSTGSFVLSSMGISTDSFVLSSTGPSTGISSEPSCELLSSTGLSSESASTAALAACPQQNGY